MKLKFIDHILIIIGNIDRTVKFYTKILGKSIHRDKESVSWKIGDTKIFFGLPFKNINNNKFDKNRIGLNHLAFGVRTLEELKMWQKKLDDENIQNSGIIKDKHLDRDYIWFDDPDLIRQEIYLRPNNEK